MDALLNFIPAGQRTYFVAFAGIVVVALQMFGYIDPEVANQVLTVLGFTGAITLRAAVKNAEPTATKPGA